VATVSDAEPDRLDNSTSASISASLAGKDRLRYRCVSTWGGGGDFVKQAKLKVIENAGHGFYFGEPFEQSVRYTVDCLRKWSEDAFTMEDKAE